MRIAIIINPVAGRGRRGAQGAERRAVAEQLLRAAGLAPIVDVTRGPGHARELARQFVADGSEAIVVWGGDGTVNEAAGPLLGSRTTLGIVPCGSGDGLARGLGLTADPRVVFHAVREGSVRAIDAGFLGERHFLNIAGIGFDAAVAAAYHGSGRYGALGYAAHSLSAVWTYSCAGYRLALGDAAAVSGPRFVVAFANGGQYGNGLVVAADADPGDGWLNAVVVAGGSPLAQLWRARRLFLRRLARARGIERRRIRTASVEGEHLLCHVDGEPFETRGRLDVRIEPGALLIAVPVR